MSMKGNMDPGADCFNQISNSKIISLLKTCNLFWVGREGAIRGFIYQKLLRYDNLLYCTMALAYEKESIYNGVGQISDSLVHSLKFV